MQMKLEKENSSLPKNISNRSQESDFQKSRESSFSPDERQGGGNGAASQPMQSSSQSQISMQFKSASEALEPQGTNADLIQRKQNDTGLPDRLKSGIENLSGYSMDDVKVHYNSAKPAQLQAHAYAQGRDIHLAPGQEKHLPHEAWHVVQQKQGRVKPTVQMKGKVNINDDAGLEREADIMGVRALQHPVVRKKNRHSSPEYKAQWSSALQRKIYTDVHNNYFETDYGKQHFESEQNLEEEKFKRKGKMEKGVKQHLFENKGKIAKRAEKQLKKAYNAAIRHMWQSEEARRTYALIANSKKKVTIMVGAADTNAANGIVDWDPWQFGVLTNFLVNGKPEDMEWENYGGIISSATLLFHELGHIKQDIEAEEFVNTYQDKQGFVPLITKLEGDGFDRRHGFHSWLHQLNNLAKKAIGDEENEVVDRDAHKHVMEPDNVTRHERPAAAGIGEPGRRDYYKTVKLEHLPPFPTVRELDDTTTKTELAGTTVRDFVSPKNPDFSLADLVSFLHNPDDALLIEPPEIVNTSIISHLADLGKVLEQAHPFQNRTLEVQKLIDYIRGAMSYWEHQTIIVREENIPADNPPTFKKPNLQGD